MHSNPPKQLGIWRLGELIHRGGDFVVTRAQPLDAVRSPRWDYVVKYGVTTEARHGISQSIAVSRSVVHPHLIAILDGELEDEIPFVVMPHLDGVTLESHFASDARHPLPVVLWLVRQLCQALEAMHSERWSHGDIKPANAMVAKNGHLTLIDCAFSCQAICEANAPFRGTPRYAAPELLANPSMVTPASDVFAVGRILWELLTKAESQNDLYLSFVCELVEQMVDENPQQRPSMTKLTKALLRLEIETLSEHVDPGHRRAA